MARDPDPDDCTIDDVQRWFYGGTPPRDDHPGEDDPDPDPEPQLRTGSRRYSAPASSSA